MNEKKLPQPVPVVQTNPAIKKWLEPITQRIVDETKTSPRHPRQHPDCLKIAGTIACLEAGGEMCLECGWWADICEEDE